LKANLIFIKIATLCSVSYITINFGRLPAHGPLLQASVSVLGPVQSAPPPDGGGLVQVRERSLVPSPQVTLHSPNAPQLLHPPLTIAVRKVFKSTGNLGWSIFHSVKNIDCHCCSDSCKAYSKCVILDSRRNKYDKTTFLHLAAFELFNAVKVIAAAFVKASHVIALLFAFTPTLLFERIGHIFIVTVFITVGVILGMAALSLVNVL